MQATASWPGRCALWLPWRLPSLLTPAPRPQLFYQSPGALFPLLGRGGEGRGGRHSPLEVCREAGRPWGCPAPGLVLAGAEVQSLFCPQTFPGCPGSPRPCLTELYVPGGPPSAERGTSPPGALTSADAALAVSLFLSPDSLIPPLLLASSLLPVGVEFWGLSPQMT